MAMRIVVQREKKKRRFVLVKPPYPKIGDICRVEKLDWHVIETEATSCFSISFPKAHATERIA